MRKLRHPIMMFTVLVLAVIAIGVGVVAATQTSKVYGPSWGRFSVAFPGRVYGYREHSTVIHSGGSGVSSAFQNTLTITTPFEYSTASTPAIFGAPGTACYPDELDASVLRVVPAAPSTVVRLWVSPVERAFLGVSATVEEKDANGFAVATIGPQCTDGQCRAAELVSNGHVLWYLLAFSKGSVNTVENFLNSFQPIG